MKVFFSAGDVSGDINTAKIIAKLKQKYPDIKLSGLGGVAMEKAGFVSDFDFSQFNRMGYAEVIKKLPFFLATQKKFIQKMRDEKPDVLVCVDFSGFNKKLVVEANKLGIRVVWFIAPMIWVWKKEKNLKFFEKYRAYIACILPFELKHWLPRINSVGFVGNPLLEDFDYTSLEEKTAINPRERFTLALIPGSREQEVKKMLPFMIECANILKVLYGEIRVVVSKTAYLPSCLYEIADELEFETDFNKILKVADIALVTSGTASLQVGLAAIPNIVLYKTSPLTHLVYMTIVGKKKITVGLSNIVAEKSIVPEFIQDEMLENDVVSAARKIIENPDEYNRITQSLKELRLMFGDKKTSEELVKLIDLSD